MKICILLTFIGLILILDSLFNIIRRLGLPVPRRFTRYFAPLGFFLIMLGLFLNQGGIC